MFLKRNGLDRFSASAMSKAIRYVEFEIFEWLSENHPEHEPMERSPNTDWESAWGLFEQFKASQSRPENTGAHKSKRGHEQTSTDKDKVNALMAA